MFNDQNNDMALSWLSVQRCEGPSLLLTVTESLNYSWHMQWKNFRQRVSQRSSRGFAVCLVQPAWLLGAWSIHWTGCLFAGVYVSWLWCPYYWLGSRVPIISLTKLPCHSSTLRPALPLKTRWYSPVIAAGCQTSGVLPMCLFAALPSKSSS